MMISMKYFY